MLKTPKRKPGRKRPADAKFVIGQVMEKFGKKKEELGAKRAAADLDVSLASFYQYVNGEAVPDVDVLRRAKREWDIKWPKLMDPSDLLPTEKARTAEQYVFSFLDALQKTDVEIVDIGPKGYKSLQVTLRIRFTA
jgi:hypothetical protein